MGTEQYTINQDSANPISNLSGNVPLADGDYYAISRHSNGQAVSYKISYSELIKRIVSDISARFNFKSMTFCDTYNFSEFDHQHGYSCVNCYSEYKNGTGQSCIMTVTISDDMNTRQLSVFSPSLPSAPPPREPSIGEVRFLAKNQTVA